MSNFLIDIAYDAVTNHYVACFADGTNVLLGANTYEDAVLEADMLDVNNYELGYN